MVPVDVVLKGVIGFLLVLVVTLMVKANEINRKKERFEARLEGSENYERQLKEQVFRQQTEMDDLRKQLGYADAEILRMQRAWLLMFGEEVALEGRIEERV